MNCRDAAKKRFSACSGPVCSSGSVCATVVPDTYATAMLMAGMTPAFYAKQLGHSIEMFLRIYSRWIDGAQNDIEMVRLEIALLTPKSPSEDRRTCNQLM
ncbi:MULTISPECIES: hypothetical protein [unclassified Caballeronia]|uniref:hypothetical protein n=1 Tax=unclassified Caballeronia TaxID=2646786 RepID=UPI001F179E8C|nr:MULTISPECIES: hypothetical protein [unclassified Caballeronia]MCE4545115.1 hypothetical protein [Caballeronia sp. PC1]MCE4570540.1 hypothetical protein [Caballeronia sp. CLC5]